jgi:hypothetical protein
VTDDHRTARRAWRRVRAFALGLPGAGEEFPWGESVAKVNKKVFVFLGVENGDRPPGVTVKLTGPEAHAHALSHPGAAPAGYGLGRLGVGAAGGRGGTRRGAGVRLGRGELPGDRPETPGRRTGRAASLSRSGAQSGLSQT